MANRMVSREIPLNGKLVTGEDPCLIATNFRQLTNLRYTDSAVKGVAGMTQINTSSTANTGSNVLSFHRKPEYGESHLLMATTDGNTVYRNNAVVPAQGAFSANAVATLSGDCNSIVSAPGGGVVFSSDGETQFWGGDEYRCAGFIVIPRATEHYDYSDVINNTLTDAANIATIKTYLNGSNYESFLYIGSVMPINGVKFYVGTANTQTVTASAKYWDGNSYEAVSGFVDGTDVAGKSLAQTGSMTWTLATGEKPKMEDSIWLYWYQIKLTGTVQYNTTTVTRASVAIPSQSIKDIWDGAFRTQASVQTFFSGSGSKWTDTTINVSEDTYFSSDPSSYMDIGTWDTAGTDAIFVGHTERLAGVFVRMSSDTVNTQTMGPLTASYWNGTAWVDMTTTDGTTADGKAFNQSGFIMWDFPTYGSEKKVYSLDSSAPSGGIKSSTGTVPLFYYKIRSANTPNQGRISYIASIPQPTEIVGANTAFVHQNALWLLGGGGDMKNKVRKSLANTPNVFNGLNSDEFTIGDTTPVNAGISVYTRFGSTIADMAIVTKPSETWVIDGTGEDNAPYRLYNISRTVGCTAPKTMCEIPTDQEIAPGVKRTFVVWQSQYGIVAFDGSGVPQEISHDIRDLFDPNASTYLGASTLATATGFFDPVRHEYHWVIPGSREFVWDALRRKWFEIARGTGKKLTCGCPVYDTNGVAYSYGACANGKAYRLENGQTFDGNAIAHTMWFGDIAVLGGEISKDSILLHQKLVCKAKTSTTNAVTVSHYADCASSATLVTPIAMSNPAGARITQRVIPVTRGAFTFHSFKYEVSTSNETFGFEPMFVTLNYETAGFDR